MATASLATLHTAAVRLRDAADRFIVAFEQAAAEALTPGERDAIPAAAVRVEGAGLRVSTPPRANGRVHSPATVALIDMVRRPEGATPTDAFAVLKRHSLSADLNIGAERLRKLALAGHAVRLVQQNGRVRYFANDAALQAWLTTSAPAAELAAAPVRFSTETRDQVAAALAEQVSRIPADIADMVAAAAPAVEKAMATLAPAACAPQPISPPREPAARIEQPAPSASPPKPYIPPTPSMKRGERREQLTEAAYVAPVAKPTGDAIVPPDVKRTVANAPAYDLRFGVDPKAAGADPESFSAQWKRLRGEGATT